LFWVILPVQEIVGEVLTVTVNEQVEVFPSESVAVQVTVVVPKEKVLPLAGELVTTAEQLFVIDGVAKVTTWLLHCVMLLGQVPITGA